MAAAAIITGMWNLNLASARPSDFRVNIEVTASLSLTRSESRLSWPVTSLNIEVTVTAAVTQAESLRLAS